MKKNLGCFIGALHMTVKNSDLLSRMSSTARLEDLKCVQTGSSN